MDDLAFSSPPGSDIRDFFSSSVTALSMVALRGKKRCGILPCPQELTFVSMLRALNA